ncbi:DUF1624 domain-containing protein [bacterium]|nr:DUF1624 domain-containing protein [bacterium]
MTTKYRVESIDAMRGLAIIFMVLDHARIYFGYGTIFTDPTDLASVPSYIYIFKMIGRFGAPTFMFLTGIGIFFRGRRFDKRQLSRFLLIRAAWLIFIEIFVITFAWTFDIHYETIWLQVIWAIGWCLFAMSILIYLPKRVILIIGLSLTIGHHVLDGITAQGTSLLDLIWYTLHQPRSLSLTPDFSLFFMYPILPWIGVMSLGYVAGDLFKQGISPEVRKRWLIILGLSLIIAFFVLRSIQFYFRIKNNGPLYDSTFLTFLEMFNTRKAPPSMLYLFMTMGPALLFIASIEQCKNRFTDFLATIGRVPFFFYVLHLFLIHSFAFLGLAYAGRNLHEFILNKAAWETLTLASHGFNFGVVILISIGVIAILYPICKWYGDYKARHREKWWLSYL